MNKHCRTIFIVRHFDYVTACESKSINNSATKLLVSPKQQFARNRSTHKANKPQDSKRSHEPLI